MGPGLPRLGAETLRLSRRSFRPGSFRPGSVGARVLFSASAILAVASAFRLGEHRALGPPPDLAAADDGTHPVRPTLLFFFQPADCRRYAGLVRRWNALARSGTVRVVGVGLGFPRSGPARDSIFGAVRPTFHVRYDVGSEAARLLARIGHLRTPTSVLIDGGGRPLVILPPVADEGTQREAGRLIREYAERVARVPG